MLTSIILTKDEEKNIARSIRSVSFSDEIIIMDDYSKDQTTKIAKKLKTKVYKRHLTNDFAAQRNYALSKAKGEWVLFLDADETIPKSLKNEILKNIKDQSINGFYIKRRDYFLGKAMKYGETGNIKLLRLARKNSGKWARKIHEYWRVVGKTKLLTNSIIHYKNQSLAEFIQKLNIYSSLHKEELKKEAKKSSLAKIIFWPLGKFIVNYFLKLGFLDGVEGLIFALLMSFHSFLAWSKQWTD